jgi:hypothetical protein
MRVGDQAHSPKNTSKAASRSARDRLPAAAPDTVATPARLVAQRLRHAPIPLQPLLKGAGTSHFRTWLLHLISVLAVACSIAACGNLLSLPPAQTEARLPRAAPPRPTAAAPTAAARAQTRPPTPKPRPETSAPKLPGRPSPPAAIQLPKPALGADQITLAEHVLLGQVVPASGGDNEPNCDCIDILCERPIQSCLRRSLPSPVDWQSEDLFGPMLQ